MGEQAPAIAATGVSQTTLLALVSRLVREHPTAEGIERAARAELLSGAAQLIGTFRDAPRSEFRELHVGRTSLPEAASESRSAYAITAP